MKLEASARAYLNEEGMKVWGKIFSEGSIPVLSPTLREAVLDATGVEKIYMVAWDDLAPDQRGQVLNQLAGQFKAPVSVIENQILSSGMPLRAKLVSFVSISLKYF